MRACSLRAHRLHGDGGTRNRASDPGHRLFIAADAANIERLKGALRSVFDDPSIDEISVDDLVGPYPVIRYGPPEEDFVIGLVARLGDAFRYDDIEAQESRWRA